MTHIMHAPSREVIDWRRRDVERALTGHGFHPSGEWWAEQFERWLDERPRVVVIRAGRRAGKSTHATRWVIDQALSRMWPIDAGDVGIIAFVSARRWQAEDRIATAGKYLDAILPPEAIKKRTTQRIDFETPWGICSIRSFAATLGDVVGGTIIAAVLDEVARWIDDRGRNPATEVIASLKPSLLSTGGSMLMISSPWSVDDAHAKAFARGDGNGQLVAHAPTWIAAQELYTEEDCAILEPDEIIFRREYAAEPMATDGIHWLPGLLLEAAIGAPVGEIETICAGGDMAFMRDSAAIAVAGKGALRYGLLGAQDWTPEAEPLRPTLVIPAAMAFARGLGAQQVMTDSHARAHLIEAARAVNMSYRWRPENGAHWALARRLLLADQLAFPALPHPPPVARLLRQLRRVTVAVEGARLRAEHPREAGGHGDLAESYSLALLGASKGASADTPCGSRSRFGGHRSLRS